MKPVRTTVNHLLLRGMCSGNTRLKGMCKELFMHRDWLWTFVDVQGIEPTNNTAERALRPAVIYRKLSFGTQSDSSGNANRLTRNPGHDRLRLNSESLVCTFRAFTQLRKWGFIPELRSLSKFSGRNADAKSAWLYRGDTLQSYGGQVFSCCLNVLETSQLSTLPLS